jgi:hypothetical protein
MQKFEWESKFFLYWYNSSQTLVRVQIRFRDTRIVDDSFVCLCLYVVRARFVQRQSKRGSVTRLLSASKPDHLMDEIPTFVARVRAPSSSSSSSLLSYFLSLRFLNSRKPAANRRLCARSLRAVQQNHLNFTMDHRSRSFDICFFFFAFSNRSFSFRSMHVQKCTTNCRQMRLFASSTSTSCCLSVLCLRSAFDFRRCDLRLLFCYRKIYHFWQSTFRVVIHSAQKVLLGHLFVVL